MKNVLVVSIMALSIVLTAAAAGKLQVPRLTHITVGAWKFKVIGQTAPELVEKRGGVTVLRKLYIAQRGSEMFEYGMIQYQCKSQKCQVLGDQVPLKLYNQCSGFKKNNTPNCRGIISVRADVSDPQEGNPNRRTWYSCDDWDAPCADRDELSEYPSRHTPEDREFGLDF